jgi:integrase
MVLRRAPEHLRLVERYEYAALRPYAACNLRLWPKAIPRPACLHDLRHTAAILMLRAGVDAHRVQPILEHARTIVRERFG